MKQEETLSVQGDNSETAERRRWEPYSRNADANNHFFRTSMRRPDMQGVRITWYTEAILLRRSKTPLFYNGS